jgi:hypothetical protein
MLEFIIQNESIESVKISYEDKLKDFRGRLKNRGEGKEVAQNVASGGGGGSGKGSK